MTNEVAYNLISQIAAPSEREGLAKERAILLLWFLRNVRGIDDLEAYEYICDGDDDQGIDGLYLEEDADGKETLVIFQSKYPTTAKNIGVKEIRSFVGTVAPLKSVDSLEEMLNDSVQPELQFLLERFDVKEKLNSNGINFRLVLVVAGQLTKQAHSLVKATNTQEGYGYLTVYDSLRLGPIIQAFRSPETVKAKVEINISDKERFSDTSGDVKIVVGAVKAEEIIKWPGIDDRTLYALNVRRELPKNRVSKELDKAIQRKPDHKNFMAFHNGLTVVCEKIDESDSTKLKVENMSVVNGAQSTLALKRNETSITDEVKLVVKFVEVAPDNQISREVASRSNTQNQVTPRNLRSLDGIQLRLLEEFKTEFETITYEASPDASNPASGHVIHNDTAAQLLTAIYHQKPWLAVKRQALFEASTYPTVFTEKITASHIVLADQISRHVQNHKNRFPTEYQRSWQLTKLVAIYLIGQMMRASEDNKKLLEDPASALSRSETEGLLDHLAKLSSAVLKVRHDQFISQQELDNFKVDFKNETELLRLRDKAREIYLTQEALK